MSMLCFFPIFYVHGVDRTVWTEVTSAWLAFDEVWGATVGCVVGAWLGAVPIPLDWWVSPELLVGRNMAGALGRRGDVRRIEWGE